MWSDREQRQEGHEAERLLSRSCNLPKLLLHWMGCGHMWKTHHESQESVVSSASCGKSYLRTATDGGAGIKWHLRTAASGWMPTRCSWSLCPSLCVCVCVFVCVCAWGLHMGTLNIPGVLLCALLQMCVCGREAWSVHQLGLMVWCVCVLVQEHNFSVFWIHHTHTNRFCARIYINLHILYSRQ